MLSYSAFPPQFFLSDDEHVAKQGKESPHSARKLDIVPHSAEGADNTDASSSEWVKSPVFNSASTCLDDCIMHVFATSLKCFHQYSDWVRPLGRDWTMRYVAMSQASRGPAGHDLMDQSRSQLLRDPYITCRYGRHKTPHPPQSPQMAFNFCEVLIRVGVDCLAPFERRATFFFWGFVLSNNLIKRIKYKRFQFAHWSGKL